MWVSSKGQTLSLIYFVFLLCFVPLWSDDGNSLDTAKNAPSLLRESPQEISDKEELDEQRKPEIIGPRTPDGIDGPAPVILENVGGDLATF